MIWSIRCLTTLELINLPKTKADAPSLHWADDFPVPSANNTGSTFKDTAQWRHFHSNHLYLLLLDGLEGALLLVFEHASPGSFLNHAQDLRRLHVEDFRDAALFKLIQYETYGGSTVSWAIPSCGFALAVTNTGINAAISHHRFSSSYMHLLIVKNKEPKVPLWWNNVRVIPRYCTVYDTSYGMFEFMCSPLELRYLCFAHSTHKSATPIFLLCAQSLLTCSG